MRFPLTISANGDLYFHCTLEYAQVAIEPIDVKNGEYVIYDADGVLLEPRVVHDQKFEAVRITPTSETRKEELKELFISFFSEVGHDKAVLKTMNLTQLAEIGKAYAKDRNK